MKKALWAVIVFAAVIIVFALDSDFFRGLRPVLQNPPEDIGDIVTPESSGPLTLPSGFKIEVFAKDLPGARVMTFDQYGSLWVSQTSAGVISLIQKNGTPPQSEIFTGLNKPHGLAFDEEKPARLYIAEEDKISEVTTYSEGEISKVVDLPSGGRHTTRTLGFGPDGRLYVSIGSSCDVCLEDDPRRAAIYSMNPDGTDFKQFAKGLRNTVFFAWDNEGRMWGTDMGRDMLGDDLPPDEINIIEEGKNYGWPTCYGQNIHDTEFDKNTYIRNPCMEPFETGSTIDLPAHSAPLGLAFVTKGYDPHWGYKSNWPEEYQNMLLVAYHGSWNRNVPTGYKVVKIDPKTGVTEDFITGWLTPEGEALGRPVDLKFGPDGNLYISDDKAGVIYRVSYVGN